MYASYEDDIQPEIQVPSSTTPPTNVNKYPDALVIHMYGIMDHKKLKTTVC